MSAYLNSHQQFFFEEFSQGSASSHRVSLSCNSTQYQNYNTLLDTYIYLLCILTEFSMDSQYGGVNIFNRDRLPWKGMKLILRGSSVQAELGGGLLGISRYSQHCSCYIACTATQSPLGSAWEINKIGRFIVAEKSFETFKCLKGTTGELLYATKIVLTGNYIIGSQDETKTYMQVYNIHSYIVVRVGGGRGGGRLTVGDSNGNCKQMQCNGYTRLG